MLTEGVCAHLTGPRCSSQQQQPSPVPEGGIWPGDARASPASPAGLSPEGHRDGARSRSSFTLDSAG